jgi:hypothetical protein
MTEQQIATAVDELIALSISGKAIEALEKFYHDDTEKTDFLDGKTTKGKAKVKEVNETLISKITAVREYAAVDKIVKGNRSFIVWALDFDHSDLGTVKATEVAIQDWQDGKIIRERFIA